MDNTTLRNLIGNLPAIRFEPGMSEGTGDNLAVALASYFKEHPDRPIDDPPSEVSEFWSKWVVEKTDDALDRMVETLLEAKFVTTKRTYGRRPPFP